MTDDPRPSVRQLAQAVNDTARQVATLNATSVVTSVYLVLTVLAVSDEVLLRGEKLQLPFFGVSLPLDKFFWVVPILVVALHWILLLQVDLLRREIARLERAAGFLWHPWAHTLSLVTRLGSRQDPLGGMAGWASVISLILPFVLLVSIERVYLPVRSWVSWFHAAMATLDLLLLASFLWLRLRWEEDRRFWRRWPWWPPPWRAGLVIGLTVAVWALLGVEELRQLDLRNENLTGLDLSGRDLRSADFSGATLIDVNFRGADLSAAIFVNADLSGADFNPLGFEQWTGAAHAVGPGRRKRLHRLQGERFEETRLVGAKFEGAVLRNAQLLRVIAIGADFDGADLSGAQLSGADLRGASFEGNARLVGTDLYACRLDNARLGGADLTGAVLTEADLTGADLTGASLLATELSGTELHLTILLDADLRASRWIGASVLAADFLGASLQRSRGAAPQTAILRHAEVHSADLCGGSPDNRISLADLRGLDETTPFESAGPTEGPLEKLDSLPLVAVAVERLAEEVDACLPVPSAERAGFAEAAYLDDFYAELASRLIARLCHTGDVDLAMAIRNEVGRREPHRLELSRRLSETLVHALEHQEGCRAQDVLQLAADED